jgi:putative transposase
VNKLNTPPQNIRTEDIKMLKGDGSALSTVGRELRPNMGMNSHLGNFPGITEGATKASHELE